MTKEEIAVKVADLVSEEFEIDKQDVTPEADIKKTLDLDSLSMVDLIALLEENFGIKVKGADIIKANTFDKMYDLILSQINNR